MSRPATEKTYERKARALARRLGIKINANYSYVDGSLDEVWFWPPTMIYRYGTNANGSPIGGPLVDPHDCYHFRQTWHEVHDCLLVYERDMATLGWGVADGGLLAAALARKGGPAEWMVYADWLDEHDFAELAAILRDHHGAIA